MGTPSHLGHMDRVAATMPSQAHAAQQAPDIGQREGQDVPLVRPFSCNVKGGIASSRRYLPTYLLGEFFAVCQENHTRLKLEKSEFMQETMQYLGFDFGYGWWTPAASKTKPLMDAKVRHEDPKKGLHDVRSSIGACNFYRRHIKNFTYTSAILTDLIKKSTTSRWGPQEQQAFDELKDKVANAKCLGVLRHRRRLSW